MEDHTHARGNYVLVRDQGQLGSTKEIKSHLTDHKIANGTKKTSLINDQLVKNNLEKREKTGKQSVNWFGQRINMSIFIHCLITNLHSSWVSLACHLAWTDHNF